MTTRVTGVDVDPFKDVARIRQPEPFHLCRVVITKPYTQMSVAEKCLAVEGIAHRVNVVEPSRTYAERPEAYAGMLAALWQDGREFINLEHDVAPWPGALIDLWSCPQPFCYFCYPSWSQGHLTAGLGCMKFGQRVLDRIPNSWEDWGNVPWWDLDGAIVSDVIEAGFEGHVHSPPVAHVRRPMGEHVTPATKE